MSGAEATLTPDEAERLPGLVAAVLADPNPKVRLRDELSRLDSAGRPAFAVALFERLVWRVDTRDEWLLYHIGKMYTALGPARQDAAYLIAALTVQMAPEWRPAGNAASTLFRLLRRDERFAEAAELFRHRLTQMPEHALIEPWEIEPVLARLGQSLPRHDRPDCAADDRRDHALFAAELRPPWLCRAVDDDVPLGLARLASGQWERPAVMVAELADAEVLILHDTVIVLDRAGVLHGDLSVAAYPEAVRGKFMRLQHAGTPIPLYVAEDAVVISDYCPPPNLCHFLLDQMSRLGLYQRVGVDTARALVIGPDPAVAFREAALRLAGLTSVLGTDRIARVRARRLWVSSNCREVRHFAHWGAAWAIDYVRAALGGRGSDGQRRLYVSRRDADRRRVVNEAEVVALLERHGFEVIVPGQLPYPEQVAAFRQASHVIAPHGAALTHLVLCPPRARVLEIFHPLFTETAFAMQTQAGGIDYVAMLARDGYSDAPEWNVPDPARGMGEYSARDLRIDLDRLGRYLATVS